MTSTFRQGTEALPANLKSLREMRGLTQAQLGTRAGLAAAVVSHFETGQRAPSIESLARLADALEVSADVLLGRRIEAEDTHVDPVFLRASRASASTLDTIRKIAEALLAAEKAEKRE